MIGLVVNVIVDLDAVMLNEKSMDCLSFIGLLLGVEHSL